MDQKSSQTKNNNNYTMELRVCFVIKYSGFIPLSVNLFIICSLKSNSMNKWHGDYWSPAPPHSLSLSVATLRVCTFKL